MKKLPLARWFTLLSFLLPAALFAGTTEKNCGCDCCKGKEVCCCHEEAATQPAPAPATHPLQGVVTGIMADKSALLVKHEEIPGVMRAMTMMFKVEPAVLQQVQRGDAIKALMSRRDDGWWLHEVVVVKP